MPLIHVTMIEGRSDEQKRALLTAITDAVHKTVGAPLDSIRVWVTDVPAQQFMSAGTLAADRRAAAGAPGDPLPEAGAGPGAPPVPPVDPILAPGGADRPL